MSTKFAKMINNKEAKARIKINKMLEESGWLFVDNDCNMTNIEVEKGIDLKSLGDDFEKTELRGRGY